MLTCTQLQAALQDATTARNTVHSAALQAEATYANENALLHSLQASMPPDPAAIAAQQVVVATAFAIYMPLKAADLAATQAVENIQAAMQARGC